MRRMTTLKNHEHRIGDLERRTNKTDEVLAAHSESLYKLRRESIENRLGIHLILESLGHPRITKEQVDEVLDAE